MPAWQRYVALGDSFTEGLSDDVGPDGRHRGWADRVALSLADRSRVAGGDGIEYANLAVRGRLIRQVVREQVPAAIALDPDLASLAVGVNDSLRRRFDLDAAATDLENGVRDLRAAGIDVLVFAFGDPSRRSRVMGVVRERIRAYNSAVEAIAGLYGCYVVRYWDVAAMDDDGLWSADRLHLSAAGHELAAASALEALGIGDDGWRTPVAPQPAQPLHRRAAGHAAWVSGHLAPWIVRRARGSSSGDGVGPKHPSWVRVTGGPWVAAEEGAK
ncbi:MAG: SGNH/GDSL hydrolase family protein [Actinobacteria bacterium]|nr:SGNH/GDSL hydrolase family protein [Actinomycetota bacterium]